MFTPNGVLVYRLGCDMTQLPSLFSILQFPPELDDISFQWKTQVALQLSSFEASLSTPKIASSICGELLKSRRDFRSFRLVILQFFFLSLRHRSEMIKLWHFIILPFPAGLPTANSKILLSAIMAYLPTEEGLKPSEKINGELLQQIRPGYLHSVI